MEIINKFQQIIEIQNENSNEKIGELNTPISNEHLFKIEKLISEPLSNEFKELYSFSNGQSFDGKGLLFGERFISSEEIIKQLEFSLTLVKPNDKTIDNPEKSEQLLKTIIDFYVDKAPKHKLLGLTKIWYKIEFDCSVGSYGGPYIYFDKNVTTKERETFKIEFEEYKNIANTIKELHELEKSAYNWDELNFTVFSDKSYKVERTFYDFDNQISFTSTPENAIKKKYFHYKWIPLFSDFGGNYIGIDLDPDTNGKKGQIINFGRDEEKMLVIADSLEHFFDLILTEIKNPNNKLINSEYHLHDTLRELKNNYA
jgi:cell wall assembly regulator SMI1